MYSGEETEVLDLAIWMYHSILVHARGCSNSQELQ